MNNAEKLRGIIELHLFNAEKDPYYDLSGNIDWLIDRVIELEKEVADWEIEVYIQQAKAKRLEGENNDYKKVVKRLDTDL